ncbi:hypothetical protein KUF71_011720, partial [Frankliniella fusca]
TDCQNQAIESSLINISHVNIGGSILNRANIVELITKEQNCDIICVTEHWVTHPFTKNSCVNLIDNFTCGAMFCRKTFQNGGSAIFVKNNLESTEINVSDLAIEGVIEPVILAFSEFIVICIYRPPDGCVDTFFNQLQLCMERIAHKKKHVFICGDLNIDILSKNNKQVKLECFMNEHGLNSLTNKATRVSYNSNTGIDHIITNVPLTNLQSRCDIEVGLSDHLLQNVLVNFGIVTKKSEKMFEFKRVVTPKNECLFLKALTDENWTNVYSAESTNEKFSSFHERFLELYNQYFPIRKVNMNKKEKDWVTKGIKITSKNFRNLCKRVKESNEPGLKKYFTEYRKIYKKVIENAKRLSIKSEILNAKNITKATWKLINKNMGKKERDMSNIEIKTEEKGSLISDPTRIADKFNVYYSEIASKLIGDDVKRGTATNTSTNISMYLTPVSENDIIIAFSKLKSKNCCGHDNVTDNVVKNCHQPLIQPLKHIIQTSFNEDQHLKWDIHLQELKSNLSKSIFGIKRIKSLADEQTALLTYYGMFHSKLSYGTLLWGNSTTVEEIFKTQKKAIRAVFSVNQLTSCKPYFVNFKIMTVYSIYIQQLLNYVKKHESNYKKCKDVHNYTTRHNTKIYNDFVHL